MLMGFNFVVVVDWIALESTGGSGGRSGLTGFVRGVGI